MQGLDMECMAACIDCRYPWPLRERQAVVVALVMHHWNGVATVAALNLSAARAAILSLVCYMVEPQASTGKNVT